MAIQEFEPQAEPEIPNVIMLREVSDGQPTVYHFFIAGQESSVTLRRSEIERDVSCYSYDFLFYDWKFASAEIISWPELTVIEEQGIVEGLDELGEIQARRLMQESGTFLIAALNSDFPEACAIENRDGSTI